ncbi:hypothetical protein OROHE_016293 [Orobanche hederae]
MVAWQTWKERNSMMWNKVCKTPTEAVFSSAGLLKEWMQAKLTATIVPTVVDFASTKCRKWHPPVLGAFKINTYAGLFDDDNMMGICLVQRGSSGEFVRAKTMTKIDCVDPMIAEAWGFLEAVRWAEAMGLVDVVVEGDAKVVVDAINRCTPDISVFGDFVRAVANCKSISIPFSLLLSKRETNVLAHELARAFRYHGSSFCWIDPPIFVAGQFYTYLVHAII